MGDAQCGTLQFNLPLDATTVTEGAATAATTVAYAQAVAALRDGVAHRILGHESVQKLAEDVMRGDSTALALVDEMADEQIAAAQQVHRIRRGVLLAQRPCSRMATRNGSASCSRAAGRTRVRTGSTSLGTSTCSHASVN